MNIYVLAIEGAPNSTAVVYAHNADEARKLLRQHYGPALPADQSFKLLRTVMLSRNPKAHVISASL